MKGVAIVSGILAIALFVMGFYMLFKGDMNLTKARGIKGVGARLLGIVTLGCAYGITFLLKNGNDVSMPILLAVLPFFLLAVFSLNNKPDAGSINDAQDDNEEEERINALLIASAKNGDIKEFKRLLNLGGDPLKESPWGNTAKSVAEEHKRDEILSIIDNIAHRNLT